MNILPEIFDKHAKYKPWLWEKYGDTFDDEKNRQKTKEKEAELKYKKDRMMHGRRRSGIQKTVLLTRSLLRKRRALDFVEVRLKN